eukprot:scaffold52289_cov51-Attheya_sp.AAC.4
MASRGPAAVWKHIGLHGHSVGTFTADANGVQWKSAMMGGADDDVSTSRTIRAKDIAGAQWGVFGKSGHMRLQTKGGENHHELRFDGFPPTDFDKLRDTFKKIYDKDLTKHVLTAAGASFGNTEIQGRNLVFRQCILEDADEEGEEFEPRDGDEMMTLDLAEVSQCVLPGINRNEIELQFHESDTVDAGTDQLVAIRLYIPPDPDADAADGDIPTSAETFQKRIMKKANIKNTTGDVIVEFDEEKGTFLTPRGRYMIELYDTFLRMRGNKYDYKIKYDDISRLFLLPKPDDVHMAFVIALDKPIRQGQQRYQYLVMQTTKEHAEVTINLDEATLKKEYNGDLQPVMNGALSNLVAKTFKVIAKKKVFIPGKFANANQQACVKCALRANEGHLYPLEKQFIFIHKPPVLIRFDEVDSVEFQRYAGGQGSTRNFDLCVRLLNSVGDSGNTKEYIFSGIDRSDYAGLYSFLSGKKIRIKNLQSAVEPGPTQPVYNEDVIYGTTAGEGEEGESSDDEDYGSKDEASESEDISDGEDEDLDMGDASDSDLEEARKKAKKGKGKKRAAESDEESSKKKKKTKTKKAAPAPSSPKKTTKKTTKKKKDPNAPKRGMGSFMFFSSAKRADIKAENPDATFGQMGKLVGEAFKSLSEEDRKEWDDKAKIDKERYTEEMKNYEAPADDSDDDGSEDEASTKKAKKDPNAPKRAMTSYMYFMQAKRAEIKKNNPDATFGEIAKLVGAEFKKLTDEEKEEWEEKSKSDKERYKKEMKSYTPPKASSSPKKAAKAKKDPNAPKKPMTSFMLYSNALRPKIKAKNPDASFGDIAKLIGKKFKSLSDEDRKKWDAKAAVEKARYKKENEKYIAKSKKEESEASADDSDDDDDSDAASEDSSDDDDSDGDDDSD